MDILDIFLDILLKPPQPLMGLFFDLSSRDLNSHNDIQLFLQQFENFRVNGDTKSHYKVLGVKQTLE